MRTRLLWMVVGIAAASAITSRSSVGVQASGPAEYTVTDVGTLGGSYSFGYTINDAGLVAGGAATPSQTDFLAQTGFVWSGGQPINLGTVDGAACPGCSSEGAAATASGRVAVISETATADINGEDFCGFGTHRQCVAAAWRNGVLRVLDILPGGHNSQVYFANNAGQMVGFSEIGTADPHCAQPFQVLRFQAVRWGADGHAAALPLPPGDTVSFASSMNDSGQAVGSSGSCGNVTLPPIAPHGSHAVLWDVDGTVVDLGTPSGGAGDNVATGINNRGDVVENSAMADGTVRAFLWNRSTGLQALATYPADAAVTVTPCCNVINDRQQIVGFSIDSSGNPHALLWRNMAPVDLNTLVPADSPWYVVSPGGINGAGEIAATAVNLQTFEVHAVVLSPTTGTGPAARGAVRPPALPDGIRQQLQRRTGF